MRKPQAELRVASRFETHSPRFRPHTFPLAEAYTLTMTVGSCANMQYQSCEVDFRLDLFQQCARMTRAEDIG